MISRRSSFFSACMSEKSIEKLSSSPHPNGGVIRNSAGSAAKGKSYDAARALRNRSVLMSESESEVEETKSHDIDEPLMGTDPTKGSARLFPPSPLVVFADTLSAPALVAQSHIFVKYCPIFFICRLFETLIYFRRASESLFAQLFPVASDFCRCSACARSIPRSSQKFTSSSLFRVRVSTSKHKYCPGRRHWRCRLRHCSRGG